MIKAPKEKPARFILVEWKDRPEWQNWFKRDNNPMGGTVKVFGSSQAVMLKPSKAGVRQLLVNPMSLLESVPWADVISVHDVHFLFRYEGE